MQPDTASSAATTSALDVALPAFSVSLALRPSQFRIFEHRQACGWEHAAAKRSGIEHSSLQTLRKRAR